VQSGPAPQLPAIQASSSPGSGSTRPAFDGETCWAALENDEHLLDGISVIRVTAAAISVARRVVSAFGWPSPGPACRFTGWNGIFSLATSLGTSFRFVTPVDVFSEHILSGRD
jgi:hypothetical protein